MTRDKGKELDFILENYIDKYLVQNDPLLRLMLKSGMLYALLTFAEGKISISDLESMFNLTPEEEIIAEKFKNKRTYRRRLLELYNNEDTRYLNRNFQNK